MQNPGLDESQAGIKISGRNINNLRYVYDTTLMAESKEQLKNLVVDPLVSLPHLIAVCLEVSPTA